jgi:hypothetical protein
MGFGAVGGVTTIVGVIVLGGLGVSMLEELRRASVGSRSVRTSLTCWGWMSRSD